MSAFIFYNCFGFLGHSQFFFQVLANRTEIVRIRTATELQFNGDLVLPDKLQQSYTTILQS